MAFKTNGKALCLLRFTLWSCELHDETEVIEDEQTQIQNYYLYRGGGKYSTLL
jgi:hypothetical protein